MCGISAIISKNNSNILNLLIDSLKLIENRGYDSIGIGFYDISNNSWIIEKTLNNCDYFNSILDKYNSSIAIGHTRWATHGGITYDNCHPHLSMNKRIMVVHNGIINNYLEIKKILINNNYVFYSETDTEVIANYIEYILFNNDIDLITIINNLKNIFIGTWGLVIIDCNNPNEYYILRNGSPLVLGMNEKLIMISSETSGLLSLFNNYISIDNNDVIKIDKNGYLSNIKYNIINLTENYSNNTPEPFKYWIEKEINEQPVSILNAINNGGRIKFNNIILGGLVSLKQELKNNYYNHLLVFGCGTSYHASMLSKFYFNNNLLNKFQTIKHIDASEFTLYDLPCIDDKVICIFCSQSGETYDIIKCIEICKKRNYYLIGVVNVVNSCISRLVDCGVYINSGREISVASTKSFTNSLIILSLIGMWFSENKYNLKQINTLRKLNIFCENIINNNEINSHISNISKFVIDNNINNMFILGTEKLYPIAKEASLKIKEISYIHAEGYSALSLKHGPFSLLDKTNITFLLIQEKFTDRLLSTYNEIICRNTNVYIVTDNKNININKNIIFIEKIDYYEEILFNIFFQKLAFNLSIHKNINPDKPKNLAKVVSVE
jgi:glucosamine--fructose-6-phosphate aminotransferase (isomerizing)